jgi:hypothetical protein
MEANFRQIAVSLAKPLKRLAHPQCGARQHGVEAQRPPLQLAAYGLGSAPPAGV